MISNKKSVSVLLMGMMLAVALALPDVSERSAQAAVLAVGNNQVLTRYDVSGGVATNGNTVYAIASGGVRDVWVDSHNNHVYYIEAQNYRQRVWRDNAPNNHDPNFGDSDLLIDFNTNSYNMEHLSIDPLRGKMMTQTEERAFDNTPYTWLNRYDMETGGFEEKI